MNEHEPNIAALRREWLAARIMAGLGLLLLLAVVGVVAIIAGRMLLMVLSAPAAK